MRTGSGGALRFILLLVFLHLDKNSGANALDTEKDGGKSWKGPEPAPTLSPPIVFGSEGPSNADGIQPRVAAMRKLNRNTTVKVTETEVKGQSVGLGLIPIEDESTKSIRHTRGIGSVGNGSRGPNGSGGMEHGRNPNHNHHHFRHQQQQHNLYKRAANQPTKVKPATTANEDLPSKTPKATSRATTPLCRDRRGIDARGSYNGSRILGWSANKNRNNNDTNKVAVPDCKFVPEQFFSSDDESKQFAAAGVESKPSAGDLGGREIAASALSAKAEPQEMLALGLNKSTKDVVISGENKAGSKPDTKADDSEPAPATVDVNASTTTTAKPTTNTTRRAGAARFFSSNK